MDLLDGQRFEETQVLFVFASLDLTFTQSITMKFNIFDKELSSPLTYSIFYARDSEGEVGTTTLKIKELLAVMLDGKYC